MVERSGIRIDEINLLLAIIVWNKCQVFAIQLHQNLKYLFERKYAGVSNNTIPRKGDKPDF